MAARKAKAEDTFEEGLIGEALVRSLEKRARRIGFSLWIVGTTPLIAHAWSEKAKHEMLAKQVKATRDAKEQRDPDQDFLDSLYRMPDGKTYGFPAMAFKKAILSGAHKDKGITKTSVLASLWVDGELIRCHTAHKAAICDMPVVRLWSGPPEMREDMVRVGAGLNKTASLAYRAQFTHWAVRLVGRINVNVIPLPALQFLVDEAGFACGIGDWRNEKNGMFGAFHLADAAEEKAWSAFATGKTKVPPQPMLKEAA